MSGVKRSWTAAVATILLVGTLVGVAWAGPQNRPQAQDITRKVTLTGANFIPKWDGEDYLKDDRVYCYTGTCYFTAPVVFPCLPSVTVERIKLHVQDGHASAHAAATLLRKSPCTDRLWLLGTARSPDESSGGLQTYSSPDMNSVVWPSQGAYISLFIGADNITVDGVTVEYHRNI